MPKLPSPCIDVCKFRRPGATEKHCIGCSMTQTQKKMFKALKKSKERAAFVALLMSQQKEMGRYRHWEVAYAKKCKKNGVKTPKAL